MASQKGAVSFTYSAFFVSIFLFFTLSGCNDSNANCTDSAVNIHSIKASIVSKVVDGDTVHLVDGRKVRLIGINSPEIHRDDTPTEPFAQNARRQLSTLLKDRLAYIVVGTQGHDRYGRILAHIYNSDGVNVEVEMLQQGLAFHIAIPPNLSMSSCLARAEKLARHNKLGIWSNNGIAVVTAKQIHNSGFKRITGTVTRINFTQKAWWLSLDNHLAMVIYPENQDHFQRKTIENLEGKKIEIRGWVYPSHSKKYEPWRIKLETPYSLHMDL